MGKKLLFEDMQQSINAVNRFRDECKKDSKATVIVTEPETDRREVYECKFYIGHGHYTDANMPNVQIEWPEEIDDSMYGIFDCEYVNIRHISEKHILIHSENKAREAIEIDLIAR